MPTIEIFCCYARKDLGFLNDLKAHLMSMQWSGDVHIRSDTDIDAGREWKKEIDTYLNTAQIILLLISPDFIASKYYGGTEMKRVMERQKAGEIQVLPIILRPVYWVETPFGELQALPRGAEPVTSWHNRDEAFFNVAEGVRQVVVEMQKKTQPDDQLPGNAPPVTHSQPFQTARKRETDEREPEKKPGKMSDKVKVAYIGVATVIIAAMIAGIFLLRITPATSAVPPIPTRTAKPTPTSAATPTTSPSTPVLARPGTAFLNDSMTRFNDQDRWDVIDQPYATCGFRNGGYDVKVPGNQTVGGCSTNAPTTLLTDFIYEIDMTIVSGVTNDTSPTRGAGLMFRYNPDGPLNYGVSFQQDGTYYLFTYTKGIVGSLGTGRCTSFHQGKNQTNQIDVEMQGSTLTLFVNDVYVTAATDTQFQSGQLGVQIGSGNDPSEVVYNNLTVWKL